MGDVFAKTQKRLYGSQYDSRMQTDIWISSSCDYEDGDVFGSCSLGAVISISPSKSF